MALPDIPDEQFDLGVLLVHGIGESTQGQTLLGFGEPLLESLRELLTPSSSGGPANAGADVRAAWLTTPEDGGPARAEVQIDGVSPGGSGGSGAPLRSRWLLAEGWWAETFPTPTYREFLSWALGVLPATLLAHFDRRFRRAGFALSRALSGHIDIVDALRAAVSMIREGLTVALALALTPLALLVIVLILVIGALPFASMHKLAANAQRLLAATVGDSYVFMHQSITRATICARVRRRLEWLSTRCKRIAVVAHSQGAAVTHRVLRDPVTAPCDLLITFGSGLSKLTEIERGALRRAPGWMVGAIAFAALAAAGIMWILRSAWNLSPGFGGMSSGALSVLVVIELGMLALLFAAMRQADRGAPANGPTGAIDSPWPAALGFVAIAWIVCLLLALLGSGSLQPAMIATLPQLVTIVGLAGAHAALSVWQQRSHRSANVEEQGRLDRALFLEHFELRNRPDMRWFDYYASADPVSNGQLLDHFEPDKLSAAQVCNSHSLVMDHTSYWRSADDFVPRVARNLLDVLRLDGPGFATRAVNPEGARRRAWRTRCLVGARWLLIIPALVLGAQWTAEEPSWLLAIRDALLQYESIERFAWLSPAFGWIVALVIWAIVRGSLAASWHIWQRHELRTYLTGQPFECVPPCFWLMFSGAAIVAFVAVHTLAGLWTTVVVALLLVSTLLAASCVPRFRTLVQRMCRSGPSNALEALDRKVLASKLDNAMRARDKVAITQISAELRWLDAPLAIKALHYAAFTLRHANAAWLLGGLHDHLARKASHASNATQAAAQQHLAMRAYARGARLGDPMSARWAAYTATKQGRVDAERLYLRRAFRLGDASAAHSMGLRLMQGARNNPNDRQRAIAAYEEGVRRGDKLSAQFLAEHYEECARATAGVEASALRERAVRTYRAAFDLGSIRAAILAGNLRREMKNLPAARRAYEAAIRMRSADAAVRLGVLEEEEEQDEKAALAAYALASRLDRQGDTTATAMLRAGKLLERRGRDQAAAIRYRSALDAPSSGPHFPGADDAATAGVALANLLERTDRYGRRAECRNALAQAMKLSPAVVADTFVSFLDRNPDESDQFEQDLDSIDATALSASGLVTLARMEQQRHPQRERQLLEQALKREWGPGREDAAAAYFALLARNGEHPAAEELLDKLRQDTSLRTERIASALDTRYQYDAARRLREDRTKTVPR